MKPSDDTRKYVRENYIEPARARGAAEVSVRAGDVHDAMGYTNRYPLIVAALGALKFRSYANVELVRIEGPLNGANTVLTFRIL
jgi:5-methylcytosine-specific restriction protein B